MVKTDKQLAHDLRELIVVLYRQMQKHISNEEQLSVAAQNIMYQLTQKDELLPSELCTLLNISSQYISQVFNQLESLDYIARKPSASDGRKTLVSLTTKGKLKVQQSRKEREEWLAGLIAERLSSTDKEVIKKALGLLNTLIEPSVSSINS
ncbi:MarR family transcriptional regulator [Cytophagaceae bacterium DM2B3-1]|uniref:MarR family transcriptional regulator n=1 Tax=Xanthocytophaga flava TaxID=3048013 RepID=A0ABT7CH71_9BACT|nr:MarR family transcriptional regulator [Xanthocytophaga flavus]MDJ1472380.1 MarR family transcriptional regulator [Xanthocytophaga flavus]MDJ1493079.1 MarR family transcriptional regulator [Xanthocytophaga flavus]